MLKEHAVLPRSGKVAQQLIVFIHGYGADGKNLLDLAGYWAPLLPDAEFLAPDAPDMCEANPFGYQWFGLQDITPYDVRAGLDLARPVLQRYILEALRVRGLGPSDLALVGFSQGAMLALEMMFALKGLKGVIAYSGAFYPPIATLLSDPHPEVLLVHGNLDMVVPYGAFAEAQKHLKQFGVMPQALTCPGLGHSIDGEGIDVGGQFLTRLFSQEQSVIYMKQS
jgi:phospholipase/carboxylesterase